MDRGEENWCSLIGVWELDRFISDLHTLPAASTPLPETILVPFPIESALGGVRNSTKSGYAFYRQSFSIPSALRPNSSADSSAVLLHFEAIDWESHIYLNNELLDIHQGGYDAFYFDIADRVKDAPSSTYELLVGVWDPTGANNSPKGKQAEGKISHAGGLSYTSTSGIWGECLVWL
jgi:hypothetical protein